MSGEDEEVTRARRVAEAARRVDSSPKLLNAARALRRMLPGDDRFGDSLSTAGERQSDLAARRLAELTAERPGVLREAGMSALQVWQSFSESRGRGRGEVAVTILFTDLVGFSEWALSAGDTLALSLLREVGDAIEPPVAEHRGRVVKRLGDGMMAAFREPQDALEAAFAARDALAGVEIDGHTPRIRAGLHTGQPRKIGGDYLGVDVNIAARVAEAAGADEILVSDRSLAELDRQSLRVRKKRNLFGVKGVPSDIEMYSVVPKAPGPS
jgi:class 3 adenylate cyclase